MLDTVLELLPLRCLFAAVVILSNIWRLSKLTPDEEETSRFSSPPNLGFLNGDSLRTFGFVRNTSLAGLLGLILLLCFTFFNLFWIVILSAFFWIVFLRTFLSDAVEFLNLLPIFLLVVTGIVSSSFCVSSSSSSTLSSSAIFSSSSTFSSGGGGWPMTLLWLGDDCLLPCSFLSIGLGIWS